MKVKSAWEQLDDRLYDYPYEEWFGYEDVFIMPKYSEIVSRAIPNTSSELFGWNMDLPIISANMDTITGNRLAIEMRYKGAVGALHRVGTIQEIVEEYKVVTRDIIFAPLDAQQYVVKFDCIVSVGVKNSGQQLAMELYRAGARKFLVDVAHGHNILVRDMIDWLRNNFPDIYIIAGNVMTPEGARDLDEWGADAIKVGLANSPVCTTKYVTGVESPMITALQLCRRATKKPIIADGGIKNSGDICKALGAGADFVMCGYLFSQCEEVPHATKGMYRGNSSKEAKEIMAAESNYAVPEGKTIEVETKHTVAEVLHEIKGGLRSCMSYIGAKDLNEFREKVRFGIKRR